MVEFKFFFVVFGILCHQAGTLAQNACNSTGVWGRKADPIMSQPTIIPAELRDLNFTILPGYNVCAGYNKYFVGEEVEVCDHDAPPLVDFQDPNDPEFVRVHRNGLCKQRAIAHTIYYCDVQP